MERPAYRPTYADEVAQAARRVLAGQMRDCEALITSPQLVCDFLRVKLGTLEHEVFDVIHPDVSSTTLKCPKRCPHDPCCTSRPVQPISAGTVLARV
jgi:DNA repair protein RadC